MHAHTPRRSLEVLRVRRVHHTCQLQTAIVLIVDIVCDILEILHVGPTKQGKGSHNNKLNRHLLD